MELNENRKLIEILGRYSIAGKRCLISPESELTRNPIMHYPVKNTS